MRIQISRSEYTNDLNDRKLVKGATRFAKGGWITMEKNFWK